MGRLALVRPILPLAARAWFGRGVNVSTRPRPVRFNQLEDIFQGGPVRFGGVAPVAPDKTGLIGGVESPYRQKMLSRPESRQAKVRI